LNSSLHSPPIPETALTSIIFAFSHMCLHCIHPPTPFHSTSHWCQLPNPLSQQCLFHPPVL
jgi:hypothetical protein